MHSIKKETENSVLVYQDNIMTVRLKENVEITVGNMIEQYQVQSSIVGENKYGVLVDATKNSNPTPEARRFMADHMPPNRVATAIVGNNNIAAMIVGNFYLRVNNPKVPTRLFMYEKDAYQWLREQLNQS